MTRGYFRRKALELRAGDLERVQGRAGDHVGGRLAVEQRRDLAEEVAAAQPARLVVPVDLDGGLAVEDDVEAAARKPAAQHPLALAEASLELGVGDRLEVGVAQVGEERQAREAADEVVSFSHRSEATAPGPVRRRRSPRRRSGRAGSCPAATSTGTSARIASVSWPIHSPDSGPTAAAPTSTPRFGIGEELQEARLLGALERSCARDGLERPRGGRRRPRRSCRRRRRPGGR